MEKERCEICLHTITNPVCNDCYLREIEEGLKNIHVEKNKRSKLIKDIKARLPDGLNETECVFCGGQVNLCSFCVLQIAQSAVLKNKASIDAAEYLQINFNYEKSAMVL